MNKLTIGLIIVLVILGYLIYTKRENFDEVKSKCVRFDMNDIQSNEINYGEKDVESQYFNQLERDKSWNERKAWLNNMELEKKRQSTHQCLLE